MKSNKANNYTKQNKPPPSEQNLKSVKLIIFHKENPTH